MDRELTESVNSRSVPIAPSTALKDDLLWGVDAIAAELNLSRRQAYWQLENGRLPARKHSGKWLASRSGLRRHFASILNGEVA